MASYWKHACSCAMSSVLFADFSAAQPTMVSEGLTDLEMVTTSSLAADLREVLESPESQSKLLNRYLKSDSGWQFLKDINFEFKVFDAESANDPGLGFTFDYSKSLQDQVLECGSSESGCVRGLDLSISAKGSYAFDEENNPRDLTTINVSFDYFKSTGGAWPENMSVEALAARQDAVLVFDEKFGAAETVEEEEAAVSEITDMVRPFLTPQFYYSFGGDVSVESNQQWTTKQTLYGVHAVIDYKDWAGSSAITKFNFFDYPFAAIRALTGYDCFANQSELGGGNTEADRRCFRPRGTSWPTLLFRVSRVKPEDQDPRTLAGDSSDFTRLDFEASFRTPVANVMGDNVYFAISYRFYSEKDPLPVIEVAELDEFEFLTVTIGGDEGLYVSYSDGRLPLEFSDDQVVELGFKYHL